MDNTPQMTHTQEYQEHTPKFRQITLDSVLQTQDEESLFPQIDFQAQVQTM